MVSSSCFSRRQRRRLLVVDVVRGGGVQADAAATTAAAAATATTVRTCDKKQPAGEDQETEAEEALEVAEKDQELRRARSKF